MQTTRLASTMNFTTAVGGYISSNGKDTQRSTNAFEMNNGLLATTRDVTG